MAIASIDDLSPSLSLSISLSLSLSPLLSLSCSLYRSFVCVNIGGMLRLLDGGMDEFVKSAAPEANKVFSYWDVLPSDIKY